MLMKHIISVTLLLSIATYVVAQPAPPTDAAGLAALAAKLADGPGKEVVVKNCFRCHELTPIVGSGLSKDGWTSIIHRMIGFSIPEGDVDLAATYLTSHFPPLTDDSAEKALENGVVQDFVPVTEKMLLDPDPSDWLMINRTYDSQRYSPLKQIDTKNVGQLRMAWSRGIGSSGTNETVPLVYRGVIYTIVPGAIVQAIDGTNGELIWEYRYRTTPQFSATARAKSLSLYQDILVFPAPDGMLVGLDARTGAVRWQTKAGDGAHTSGAIPIGNKIVTGRACIQNKLAKECFISAHDALTGKEVWRFNAVPKPGEPGSETWGNTDLSKVTVSPWGLPGSYDPKRNLIYWGLANPVPYTRLDRYGSPDGVGNVSPVELYSNSSLALDADTGKLKWYYQHLAGDDWDEDYNEDRVLLRTAVSPDPKFVKWINPDIKKGEVRDIVVNVGEGGGIFALDRANGEFLWATPFPYDSPNFLISDIDVKTGKVHTNYDLVMKKPGDHHVVCFYNTTSFWPSAYSPKTNSLYVPYVDNCLDMTAGGPQGPEKRVAVPRVGSDPNKFAAIAKVNLATGEILRIGENFAPDSGAVLATAGNLIFHGDLNRRFRAFDAETGKPLWESILGGPVVVSTITYAVKGKQYVLVMTGDTFLSGHLARRAGIKYIEGHNTIYVFALP
ncbi:MAG: PQQ-binding-like beta-propeller repeat protein [Steroidobacteraceae bacterium]